MMKDWSYPAPPRYVRPTAWARDWRRRWFRFVGTAVVHQATGRLTLIYSTDRTPDDREDLRAELEAHPDGPALVYHECRRISREWDRRVTAANRRFHERQAAARAGQEARP